MLTNSTFVQQLVSVILRASFPSLCLRGWLITNTCSWARTQSVFVAFLHITPFHTTRVHFRLGSICRATKDGRKLKLLGANEHNRHHSPQRVDNKRLVVGFFLPETYWDAFPAANSHTEPSFWTGTTPCYARAFHSAASVKAVVEDTVLVAAGRDGCVVTGWLTTLCFKTRAAALRM